MNAFNLSVCIAPSMLWAPSPSTPEMEGEDTKKVRRKTHTHTHTHTHHITSGVFVNRVKNVISDLTNGKWTAFT